MSHLVILCRSSCARAIAARLPDRLGFLGVSFAVLLINPSRKDVVTSVLGASAALGGFVLVFMGLLLGMLSCLT